jgi:tetratricopeptide (TPR) repeat protein
MTIRLIQKPSIIPEMMVYIRRNEKATISDFIGLGLNQDTAYTALEKMMKLKLVFREKEAGFPVHIYYYLTKKGEMIANKLLEIESVLEQTVARYKADMEALEEAKGTEEEMLDVALKLGELCYAIGEWDEAIKYSERSLVLARSLDEKDGVLDSQFNIARIYEAKSEWDKALGSYQDLLDEARIQGKDQWTSEASMGLGRINWRRGSYDEAIKHLEACLAEARESSNTRGQAKALVDLGNVRAEMGEYDQALKFHSDALKILEELQDMNELARCYNNMGTVFRLRENYDMALEHYKKQLKIARKMNNPRGCGYGLTNAGYCHAKLGDLKKAMEYNDEAFELAKPLDDKNLTTSINLTYGVIYSIKREWNAASMWFSNSLDISKNMNIPYTEAMIHLEYGNMLKGRGTPDEAMRQYELALNLWKNIGNKMQTTYVSGMISALKAES